MTDTPTNPNSSDPADSRLPPGTVTLGLWFFLLSLTMLFAASMVLFVVARLKADSWPPPDMPVLPRSLWISTGILLLASVAVHSAVSSIRQGHARGLCGWLALTCVLAVAFLASQTWTWLDLTSQGMPPTTRTLYSFVFYLLTVLHAVHTLGGLVPLGIVTVKSWRGRYSPENYEGVKHCALYWHFLDVVWLIIFSMVYLDLVGYVKS